MNDPNVGNGYTERKVGGLTQFLTDSGWANETADQLAAARALGLSRERRIDLAEEYLAGLHTILWQTWNVHERKGRRAAAEFIVDLYDEMNKRMLVAVQ